MTKSDYESRHWAAKMKLWKEYKTLSTKKLISIVKEGTTLHRQVAAMEMQCRGGDDVIKYAMNLCSNKNYKLREIGAFVLGQVAIPDRQMLLEVVNLLMSLAKREKSIRVRYTAIYSVGHRCAKGFTNYEIVMSALQRATDSSIASVREAAAFSLAYTVSPKAPPLLEKLLLDPDRDVRNWAGFAVNNSKADSSGIRESLVKMLSDPFDEARMEAISALASRQDKRVIPTLKHEIEKDPLVLTVVEAIADFGDPKFIPILEKLLSKFDDEERIIQHSIEQLKKNIP